MDSLTMLVIADQHYVHAAGRECTMPERIGRHALEWTRRAIEEATRIRPPDVIVLLGDIVDNGFAAGAEQDMAEFATVVKASGVSVVVVPGNHDVAPERVFGAFGDFPGRHCINDYILYSFADNYGDDDTPVRHPDAIKQFLNEVKDRPVITLQHPPLYPAVDCTDYPFTPSNTAEIMAAYKRAGVVLSLSGHYHRGTQPALKDGVTYLTCAAIAEAPFHFYIVSLLGREVTVDSRSLQIPSSAGFVDTHIHTHFGYCAEDVHPRQSSERAKLLGVKGIVCVEHAAQLYLSEADYWQGRHVDEPEAIRNKCSSDSNRMPAYRSEMAGFRSDYVRIGLEVECDCEGSFTLLDEDRDGWDMLLGAVHWLPGKMAADTRTQRESSFLRVVEQLTTLGIDILGHPFRFFHKENLPRPIELYRPVARLLRAHNVAAEINFHTNEPDPDFFRRCLEEEVRIVVGSDAHALKEVGDLLPHLRLLQEIGFETFTRKDREQTDRIAHLHFQ